MSHYYTQQAQRGRASLPKQYCNPAAHAPQHVLRYKPSIAGTELETDFEDDAMDSESEEEYYYGRRSEDSTSKRSETTVSSHDEVQTPNLQSVGFTFHQLPVQDDGQMQGKAMQGPSGPSLFRMSQESSANMDIYLSMSPPTSPVDTRHLVREDVPAKQFPTQRQPEHVFAEAPRTSVPLRTWTPWQVADWMNSLGFERSIIDQFFLNDISGVTLIDLEYENLKELGISSFGQRHRLWTEIRSLKEQTLASKLPPTPGPDNPWQPSEPLPALTQEPQREFPPVQKCSTPDTQQDDEMEDKKSRRAMRRAIRSDDIISPAESASIVAIEQLLPKPHKCAKGENCAKWRRQQKKLAKIASEFPVEYSQIVQGMKSPGLESGVGQPHSVVVPSVIASSDVLGPTAPKIKLQEENLKALMARDPQDNVRQFLSFQHMDSSTKLEPETPGYELFPSLSPLDNQAGPRMNLSALPKLTIPNPQAQTPFSTGGDRTAKPIERGTTPVTAFYSNRAPVHDIYRVGSPASEMDVPVTALPVDPLGPNARDVSSSVPPDMRFGGPGDLISRSNSGAGIRERGPPPAFLNSLKYPPPPNPRASSASRSRRLSFGMAPVAELGSAGGFSTQPTLAPSFSNRDTITTAIDDDGGDVTPIGPSGPAAAGWMRKRRTKLLRHEWAEAHYRLHGTTLTSHKDDRSLDPLECIDVDDYAVAVAANQSKLNAAMKRLRLNGKDKGEDVWKFGFQLTPAEREAHTGHGTGVGKTHHFAVRSQNERIDWMRELMLARAKKGKDAQHERFE